MKRIIYAVMAAGMLFAGCSGEQAEENANVSTATTVIGETAATERVLAMAGTPDGDGYYTIDLPRRAADLMPLEQINSRLYWTASVMVDKNIKSFDTAPQELVWQVLNMETAFNYGSTPPFNERSDGTGTVVSAENLRSFAKECFALEAELSASDMPEGFVLSGGNVHITYLEPNSKAFGFVMSEYKQEGNVWYIKGDIMSSADSVFCTGTFILEENAKGGTVSHKIVSFGIN